MSNASAKKIFIQIESEGEQQEHLKNQRKTLKVLQQGVAIDKENLAGRPELDKLSRLKAATEATLHTVDHAKRKKIETRSIETQTSPQKQPAASTITAKDLTTEGKPSESYWERLAEKRRTALEETLTENQRLHERIEGLEAELSTSRQTIEEAGYLVEVLTGMLNEKEGDNEDETQEGGVEPLKTGDDDSTSDSKSSVAEEPNQA